MDMRIDQSVRDNVAIPTDSKRYVDECSKECPGECPPVLPYTDIRALSTFSFQHVPNLYQQSCTPGYSVICNPTNTGVIAVLDEEACALLARFAVPMSFPRLLENLPAASYEKTKVVLAHFYQAGFLYAPEQHVASSCQQPEQTLNAWLHTTNACNLSCDCCYVEKSATHMSDQIAYAAIESVFRMAVQHGFQRVGLRYAGGEASLLGTRILALHDYALAQARRHSMPLYASILSNGAAMPLQLIHGLKARNIGMMISLDGVGSYHDRQRAFRNGMGSFRFVDRTISRLLEHDLVPALSVTVSQRNLAGLPELMDYILDRDLPFSLNYYRDNDCSSHFDDLQFDDLQMIEGMRSAFAVIERRLPARSLLGSLLDKGRLDAPSQYTCGVGQNYVVIDEQGGIAKCHMEIKKTVTTISARDPLTVLRQDQSGVQSYAVDDKEGCRSCQWRYWCRGGCPMQTYKSTGRSDVKSPNCNIYKALFPEVLHLEALRLLKYVSPLS